MESFIRISAIGQRHGSLGNVACGESVWKRFAGELLKAMA
ncbi:MAG: hypothetical protein ANABAC_0459 [Anaerolineae bacterium]|nr:MAG: hypothetical protein ANABAC_0459 [Anaerolineae bacterium]